MDLEAKIELQTEINRTVPVEFDNPENIRKSLPLLFPEQQDDVVKAERRLFGRGKKGMLFTNGTGTGKTFTGLGIANRVFRSGKRNILIVVPTQTKAEDWRDDGAKIGLEIRILENTRDSGGDGACVTTYANFGVNRALRDRKWDLILYDESHYLNSEKSGKRTKALAQHERLAVVPSMAKIRSMDFNPKYRALQKEKGVVWNEYHGTLSKFMETVLERSLTDDRERLDDILKGSPGTLTRAVELMDRLPGHLQRTKVPTKKTSDKARDKAVKEAWAAVEEMAWYLADQDFRKREDEILKTIDEDEAKSLSTNTKAVFLSATPFPYHPNLQYGDGFLFDITENKTDEELRGGGGYNDPDAWEKFFVSNFGYHMKYGKLNRPEAEIDVGLMEREFTERIRAEGSMSGRKIEIDRDYSRQFVLLDSELGRKIDEGLMLLHGYGPKAEAAAERGLEFPWLANLFREKMKYPYSVQLTEAIKAKYSIPRIKKHIALGRKVIVFHSYNKPLEGHPFDFDKYKSNPEAAREIEAFETHFPEYRALDIAGIANVPDTLKRAFGSKCVLFRGGMSGKAKASNVGDFNRSGSGVDVFVAQQRAGREGISLHDKIGDAPRVVYILALPGEPVACIQMEGRAYRMGQKSDAIFEYPTLHTLLERHAFGSVIAQRTTTAENLAMGEAARKLDEAYRDGYNNATDIEPNEHQGTGGKDADANNETVDDFDRAITWYYARGKKTSRDKSREGKDYFATPEPLGMKMVEWANVKPGESMLEPSGGHGAIARFFPKNTVNTMVEPSPELASQLKVNAAGNVVEDRFEDLDVGANKYDTICMNPPFGKAGKQAAEHLEKATRHLRNGGRIVAILPDGPSMRKRLDKFWESDAAVGIYPVAEISMPACTFERAGTQVRTFCLILEKQLDPNDAPDMVRRDLKSAGNITEFFERLKGLSIPDRKKPSGEDSTRALKREREIKAVLEATEAYIDQHRLRNADIEKQIIDSGEDETAASLSMIVTSVSGSTGVGPRISEQAIRKVYFVGTLRLEAGKSVSYIDPNRPPLDAEGNVADKDPDQTPESAAREIAEEMSDEDERGNPKIPENMRKRFDAAGITIEINKTPTRLLFSTTMKTADAYSRILMNQPKGKGQHLYKGFAGKTGRVKNAYSGKFHKDYDGETDYRGAWWHIDAKHLDDLEKIADMLRVPEAA